MPYEVRKYGSGWVVINSTTGRRYNKRLHLTKREALAHQRALYANTDIEDEGEGLFDDIKDKVKGAYNAVTSRLKAFQGVRLDYRPDDRKFISSYGDWVITSMTIQRAPVESYVKTLTNILSLGKFKDLLNKHYDDVYHLALRIILSNGSQTKDIIIEKNQTIAISNWKPENDVVSMPLKIPGNITFKQFLTTAENSTTKDLYYRYDPLTTNCQQYLMVLLKANGILQLNPESKNFIFQDLKILRDQLPSFTQTIMKKLTDAAAVADVAIKGYGLYGRARPSAGSKVPKQNATERKQLTAFF